MNKPAAFVLGVLLGGLFAAAGVAEMIGNVQSEDRSVVSRLEVQINEQKIAIFNLQNQIVADQRVIADIRANSLDLSDDTVIYETVSSPQQIQEVGKILGALSLNPALKGLGMLLSTAPQQQQIIPAWIVPGRIRPIFLRGNSQGTGYRWIDAKSGVWQSDMLSSLVFTQGGN